MLKRPFKFGNIELPSNVFCAPLAGCSDIPFRRMAAKYKPGLMYCEMVKMDALVRNIPQTFDMLKFESSMRPIGAQICGSKPSLAAQSAKMIEDLGFDVIDLNCGCPVDKITKDGSGSGMLKNPEVIGEIISEMVSAVKIPVTVKIRIGWDLNSIVAPEITQIAEKAGATAITIHGRTREQAYKGPANWDYIKECKQVANKILVIGNGDIFSSSSAEEIIKHTGCDAILLARGMMGQPWLIEDIYAYLENKTTIVRTHRDLKEGLLEHFDHVVSCYNDRLASLNLRKVGCWYLRNGKDIKQLREIMSHVSTTVGVRQLIENYEWEGCCI